MSYEVSRGESKTFEHTVTDVAGDPVDLTDAEISFVVRGLDGEIVLTKTSASADEIELTDEDEGIFLVKLTAAETAALAQTARWADCWVVTGAEDPETLKVADHAPFHVTGEAPA